MIGNGARDSAATSYLADNYLARKNLHVVVNTHVTRVLPSARDANEFKTLEVVSNVDSQ